MLTWAIGLMGVGLAYGYSLLGHAPWSLRCAALLPWVLGILTALTGRILGAECRNQNDRYYSAEVTSLGLAAAEEDPQTIRRMFSELIRATEAPLAPLKASAERFMRWANGFYYGTHALFGLGVIAVAAVLLTIVPAPGPHIKEDLGAQLRRECESIIREYVRGEDPPGPAEKYEPLTKFCIERRAGLGEK